MANTSLIIPYKFAGETKAVANEVNANFEAIEIFSNGVNAKLEDLNKALTELQRKPTREMFDVYFNFSGIAPVGAYPLWTGETIFNCRTIYPDFWKEAIRLKNNNAIRSGTSEEYDDELKNYGETGMFVVDELNGHIRLPKILHFISSIADLSQNGWPYNDTQQKVYGNFWTMNWHENYANSADGNFKIVEQYNASIRTGDGGRWLGKKINLDSGVTCRNGDYVQPRHVKLCLYLQVANNVADISMMDTNVIANELADAIEQLTNLASQYITNFQTKETEINTNIIATTNTFNETATEKIDELSGLVSTIKESQKNVEVAEENVISKVDEIKDSCLLAQEAAKKANDSEKQVIICEEKIKELKKETESYAKKAEEYAGDLSLQNIKNKITNCITEIPQDIKLELNDGSLILKAGSKVYVPNGFDVNCGIYGTPSISDGIASGFSINNYLTLPRAFNPGSNPWEIVIKTTTPSSIEKSQVIFDSTNGTNVFRAVSIYFSKASKTFTYCLSGSGSAHDIADNVAGSNVLDYSTTYYVKLIFDGGSYKSYISTDGVEWILDFSISSSTNVYNAAVSRLGYFAYDTSLYYQGTIDLPNCYIKIADEIFWQGKTGVGNRIFEEIVIENDVSLKQQFDDNDLFVFVYRNYNGTMTLGTAYKGTTYSNEPDVVGDYKLHYMACYNKIFWDEPSYESTEISMPIAVVNRSAIEGYNSINQIFNGMGYIGSTIFALPGVKGLIPNGRNADGSLKNIEFTVNKVLTGQTLAGLTRIYGLSQNTLGRNIDYVYDERTNLNHVNTINAQIAYEVPVITVVTDSNNTITSFTPKFPFRAVDHNNSSWVAEQAMPSDKYTNLTLGATGSVYTAPANGFVYLKRTITSQGFQAIVNLDAGELTSEVRSHIGAGESERNFLPVKKGQRFMVQYDGTTTYPIFRFIYAEGEI